MKNKKLIIINICLLSFVVCVLIGIIVLRVTRRSFSFSGFYVKTDKIFEQTYALDEIETILINTKAIDIIIKEGNQEVKIEYYGFEKEKEDFKANLQNQTLQIDYENKKMKFCIGFCFIDQYIVIYLPSNYQGKMELSTTSGDVKSESDWQMVGTIQTKSGDVKLQKGKDITVQTISGDIRMQAVENGTLTSKSGEIKVETSKQENHIKTISGDIVIYKMYSNLNSTLQSTSGDIRVTLGETCQIDAYSRSGDVRYEKQTSETCKLEVETISGDIRIK